MKRLLFVTLTALCAVVLLSSCKKEQVNAVKYSYEYQFTSEGNDASASAIVEQMISTLNSKGINSYAMRRYGIGLIFYVRNPEDDYIARKLYLDACDIISMLTLNPGTELSLHLFRKEEEVSESVDVYYSYGLESGIGNPAVSFATKEDLKRSKEFKLTADNPSVDLVPVFVKGDGSLEVASGYKLSIQYAKDKIVSHFGYISYLNVVAEGAGTTEAMVIIKNSSNEIVGTEKVTFKVEDQYVELQNPGVSQSSVYSAGIYHAEGKGYNIVLSMSPDIYVNTMAEDDDIHSLLYIDLPEDAMNKRVSLDQSIDSDNWHFAFGAQNTKLGPTICYTYDTANLSGSYCEVYRFGEKLMIDCKILQSKMRIKFYGRVNECGHYIWSNFE